MEVRMRLQRDERRRWLPRGTWGIAAMLLMSCSPPDPAPSLTEDPGAPPTVPIAEPIPEDRMPDMAATHVGMIPPGTTVAERPPEGWSHLILKTHPEVSLGDVDKLSDSVRSLSRRFFSAMMARVALESTDGPMQYRLDEVAVGLGTTIAGRDLIVTPETQQ